MNQYKRHIAWKNGALDGLGAAMIVLPMIFSIAKTKITGIPVVGEVSWVLAGVVLLGGVILSRRREL